MKHVLSLLIASIVFTKVYSQGEVPVNMYTGTPVIQIPIWTVTDHDLAVPVGLSYNASGVKLVDFKGIAGIGWQLQAAPSIQREVHGLPDDFFDVSGTRKGWLYNTVAADIGNFSNISDLSAATCTDETTDNTALANYNYTTDTEPDIFYYSAGGVSGAFVFDNALNIRLIPYQDVKIEYTTVSSIDKTILSFVITTNDGVKYTFGTRAMENRYTMKLAGITEAEFFQRDFKLYDYATYNTGVNFATSWGVSSVNSPSGATISFTYTGEVYNDADTVRVGIRNLTGPALTDKPIYYTARQGSLNRVSSITSLTTGVAFNYSNGLLSHVMLPHGKQFDFTYQSFNYITPTSQRYFLKSIQESGGCDKLPPTTFSYVGVDFVNNKCNLPWIYSRSQDFWGYYNGKVNRTRYPKLYVYPSETLAEQFRIYPKSNHSGAEYILDGADRTPDTQSMQMGSLQSITWPMGGSTTLDYEPNDYFDPAANQTYVGGGLRIKSVVYFDGVNPQNNIVKNYDYRDASLVTSGRLANRPVFSVPVREYRDPDGTIIIPYSTLAGGSAQTMWESLIVRTAYDISNSIDGQAVGYGHVKVSRPGSGSAEFDFSVPATYGSGATGDWTPTLNKFARPNTPCPSMEIVSTGGAWIFPFSMNPNFGYDRGFMLKKTEKSESGIKVRETTYVPQYIYKTGATPVKVYGLSYDHYPYGYAIYFFGKYFLLTDVDKTVSSETVVTYDANDQTQTKSTTETTEYFFESSAHRLLTRTKTTGAAGSIVTQRIKYPLDYGTIPANADIYLKKIGDLQTNFRNGTAIEQTTSIQPIGGTDKIVSASLVKFSDLGVTGKIYPYQTLVLTTDQGLTDFTSSGQLLQGATYVFNQDSRYQVTNTILAYDAYDVPLSMVGKGRITKSTHWGFNKSLPVVQAVNASYNEFAFSDFETSTGNEFQFNTVIYGAGRTGDNALHPSVKLTKTLQKANVNNYILSFWMKRLSGPVDFQLVLKNASTLAVISTIPFTVTNTGANFERYQKTISVTSLPSSFIAELQGQNFTGTYSSSSSLLPVIDDVAFYPEGADLVSYTYDIPFGQNSVTDATGTTAYVTYDGLGREKYVWDKDKNLVKKNTYKFASNPAPALTADIIGMTSPLSVAEFAQVTYRANVDCGLDGVKYEWDFGDGTGFHELSSEITHAFSGLPSFNLTLRKSHPLYPSVTKTIVINVVLQNFTAAICAKGAQVIDCNLDVTSTYSCAAITGTPTNLQTIFKVTNIYVNETPVKYEWSIDGGTTWGTGTDTFITTGTATCQVKCKITTSTGRIGYSNTMTVTRNHC